MHEEKLPVIPEFELKDDHSNWQQFILWQKFQFQYFITNGINNIFHQFHSVMQHYGMQPCRLEEEDKPLASLWPYYRTLPQTCQDHEGVKMVYMGLEYKSPEWTTAEK